MVNEKSLKIKALGDGVYEIDTFYVRRDDFTACYLIEDHGRLAVVETNTNHAVPHLLAAVESLGRRAEDIQYVILTHIHLDHAGGAGLLMQKAPEAQLLVHGRGRRHMIDPANLIEGVKAVYGETAYVELYGDILPVDKHRIRVMNDKETVMLGERPLEFFESPGHAKHHMVIFDRQSGFLFSGDAFGIAYPRFIFGDGRLVFPSTSPVQFEPDRALETYRNILDLKPRRILPTHYGPLDDLEDAHRQLKRWIDFSVEKAEENWREGLREKELHQRLYTEIVARFGRELADIRGSGAAELTGEEKEWLFFDCDLNAQGVAHYIAKANEPE